MRYFNIKEVNGGFSVSVGNWRTYADAEEREFVFTKLSQVRKLLKDEFTPVEDVAEEAIDVG